MRAVVERQQEVVRQLEAGRELRPELPHTVQEEEEHWGLGDREKQTASILPASCSE